MGQWSCHVVQVKRHFVRSYDKLRNSLCFFFFFSFKRFLFEMSSFANSCYKKNISILKRHWEIKYNCVGSISISPVLTRQALRCKKLKLSGTKSICKEKKTTKKRLFLAAHVGVQDQKAHMTLKHIIKIQRKHFISHFHLRLKNNIRYHLQCCSYL